MLWCASNREKSNSRFEGKKVLLPQFEMEEEVEADARLGLVATPMRVESKVEARVGGDDAQPDDELQNVEVVAKGRAARLCSSWYVFAACVGTALILHAVDASNEAFLEYESSSGLESLTDATPLQLGKMQHTRAAVFGSVKAAVLGLAGVCVAIACLLAVHSDLLNAYPSSAKRLASCAAESTACRFLYSTAVGCTSMLAVVVVAQQARKLPPLGWGPVKAPPSRQCPASAPALAPLLSGPPFVALGGLVLLEEGPGYWASSGHLGALALAASQKPPIPPPLYPNPNPNQAALLLAASVGVYALSVQEVQACGFATKVLTLSQARA